MVPDPWRSRRGGRFAVQLACQRGAYVIGTVSTRNVAAARKLGMAEVIDDTETPFEDLVGDMNLVFDTTGGTRLERSLLPLGVGKIVLRITDV